MSELSCFEHGYAAGRKSTFSPSYLITRCLDSRSDAERANASRDVIINGIWGLNLKERTVSSDVEHHKDASKEKNETLERQEACIQERGYMIDLSNPLAKN